MLWMHQSLSFCFLRCSSLPRHSQKPIAVSSNWQGDQSRLRPYEQYNKKIVTGNFLSLNSIPIVRATPFPLHPAKPTPTPHSIQTRAFIMNKTRGSRIVRERGNSSGPSIIRKVYHSVISGLREGWGADQRTTSRSSWISRSCNCSLNGGAITPQTCNEREGFYDYNRSQSDCFCVPMGQQHQSFLGFLFIF